MPDHRFPRGDTRHYDRADNLGFSLVIALAGFLALGIMALAMTSDDARHAAISDASAKPAVWSLTY
jgi:hypothetical protein